jgi:D-glycero-alpha-D-manno-heptose 1-phosphate guanylyltransferase
LLRSLSLQRFSGVTLSVGYKAHSIQEWFGQTFEGMPLRYCVENEPLGTGGAIRLALEGEDGTDPIFVLNGDTIADIDFAKMMEQHKADGDALTVALAEVEDVQRYGSVTLKDRVIQAFAEKGQGGRGLINSGTYLVDLSLLSKLEEQFGAFAAKFSFESEILTRHFCLLKIHGFVSHGYFIDIGIPEDYRRAQVELPERFAGFS